MNDVINSDYINDLNKIKETIRQNQNKAMVIVNSTMIMTYYEIGTIINRRKTWGSKYIQKLSEDLKEYGKGYSYSNLKYMAQVADEFDYSEISQQAVGQIAWSTLVTVILPKSNSHEEMLWYIDKTHKHGWSRSQVLQKFKEKAYERNLIEPDTSMLVKKDDSIKELFKDNYFFDFLNKDNTKTEKSTKDALIDNVIKFIHELGPGFTVVNKEHKIATLDRINAKVGISKYKILEELPEYLERKLNGV